MANSLNQKMLDEIKQSLDGVESIALAEFNNVNVSSVNSLRRDLEEKGALCKVMRNRLLKLALEQKGMDMPSEWLQKPSMAVFSKGEMTDYAKVLVDFSKKNKKVNIKGGYMSGASISSEDVIAISQLPSREVLLSKLLGTLQAPITSFVYVLNGVTQKFVRVLGAIAENKENK